MQRFLLLSHAGHGKSTLAGRLAVEYGDITQKEVDKLKEKYRDSFYSHVMGIYEEYRVQSKTQEWNEVILKTDENQSIGMSLIDIPSGTDYITEVLKPAVEYSKDLIGLLCISSIENEYKAGVDGEKINQLILLAHLCGINNFIVCWTKCHEATLNPERKLHIINQIGRHQCAILQQIDVDAINGDGIEQLKETLEMNQLSTLLNSHESASPESTSVCGALKMNDSSTLRVRNGCTVSVAKGYVITCTLVLLSQRYTGEQLILTPGFVCHAHGIGGHCHATIQKLISTRPDVTHGNTNAHVIVRDETIVRCQVIFDGLITGYPIILRIGNTCFGICKDIL